MTKKKTGVHLAKGIRRSEQQMRAATARGLGSDDVIVNKAPDTFFFIIPCFHFIRYSLLLFLFSHLVKEINIKTSL